MLFILSGAEKKDSRKSQYCNGWTLMSIDQTTVHNVLIFIEKNT